MTSIIRDSLEQIISLQAERSFILTGFFLQQAEINDIRSLLLPDKPSIGAIGRYKGVPVFEHGALLARTAGASITDEMNGICYSYVQMDSVN